MSRGLLQPYVIPPKRIETIQSSIDNTSSMHRTKSEDFTLLEGCSELAETQERIRSAIAQGKIRVLPDPNNPLRVRIIPISHPA